MVHISPQREDRGERKKTEAANMFKALLYTQTHTHTQEMASCSRDTTLALIRPAYVWMYALFPEHHYTCGWAIKY